MSDARLAYATARIRARHSRRPGATQWGALEASRSADHYVAALRVGAWLRVPEADVGRDPDARERWLRRTWREACEEVAGWYPPRWRSALRWLAVLPDLDALEHLRAGGALPPWATGEAVFTAVARADGDYAARFDGGVLAPLTAGWRAAAPLRNTWRSHWWTTMPNDEDARRRIAALETDVREAATLAAAPRRERLERAALRTLRRSGTGPAAGFAHLLLVALQLERVRGGLAVRSLGAGDPA